MNQNITFTYNYSATENKEVLEIREKYLPKQESKLEELKRLDRSVQFAGMIESLSIGIIGSLIFGIGLCFAMHIIGNSFVLGVVIGIIGTAAMIAAYPVYRHISKNAKAKLVPKILQLTGELTGKRISA